MAGKSHKRNGNTLFYHTYFWLRFHNLSFVVVHLRMWGYKVHELTNWPKGLWLITQWNLSAVQKIFDGFVHKKLENQAKYESNLTKFSYRLYPQIGLQSAWKFHKPKKASPFSNTLNLTYGRKIVCYLFCERNMKMELRQPGREIKYIKSFDSACGATKVRNLHTLNQEKLL